jgi:hypothetical protein
MTLWETMTAVLTGMGGGCGTTSSGCGTPSYLRSALAHDGHRRCSGLGIFAWPPLPRVGGTLQECAG